MRGNVRHASGLSSSIGSEASRACETTSGSISMTTRTASIRHGALTLCPEAAKANRLARAGIIGTLVLEEMENMVRAIGCPQSQKSVIFVGERSATSDGDQPGVTDFREDQGTRVQVSGRE